MYQILIILSSLFLFSCNNSAVRKSEPAAIDKSLTIVTVKKDTSFSYKEVLSDSTIKSSFRIIYGDYKLYFDQKVISKYCDSIIRLNDERKAKYINLKKEVNHQTNILYFDSDFIILTNFRPKIVDSKTKVFARSLLISFYKNECGDETAIFHIITMDGKKVKIDTLDLPSCIT